MANALYPSYKALLLNAGLNLASLTIKAALIDTGVTAYNSAHDNYDDISSAVIGTPVTLAGKTTTGGVFDSSTNPSFTGLVAAPTIEAVVLYYDSTVASTSTLIAFIDTATGLPVASGATQVDVTWDAAGIFAL
jgi:hypothetical protein